MPHPLYPDHILRTQDFTKPFLNEVLNRTARIKRQLARPAAAQRLAGTFNTTPPKKLLLWFYEPSTRTIMSFEAAMSALGGTYKTVSNAAQFSSVYKGETIEDTVQVLMGYNYDAIVIRSTESGIPARAAAVSDVPIINAGDGSDQHPTQSLLDLFTIYEQFNKVDGLRISMCGDLKYGRTVHSLAYLLSNNFENIHFNFVSPHELKMKKGIIAHLEQSEIQDKNITFSEITDIGIALSDSDVVYQTRIQEERFEDQELYLKVAGQFVINGQNIKSMKTNAIVMHPLPVAGPTLQKPYLIAEVTPEAKRDPRFVAFTQSANGMPTRMTLLEGLLLDKRDFTVLRD